MKKNLLFAAIIAVAFASCGNGDIPKGNLKTELDTLSYELGMSAGSQAKNILANQFKCDTAYIDEFYKGFAAALQAGEDKKLAAYYAGVQMGQYFRLQEIPNLNGYLFDTDSTQTINVAQLIAGYVESGKGETVIPLEGIDRLQKEIGRRIDAYKDQYLTKTYGANKKKSEDFIAKKAKEEGIMRLPGGTLYKVIKEGNGPKPTSDKKVQVIYEGKTLDGTVFDSSEKNNNGKPTEMAISQVIPAWQEALIQMPQGSKWELYVPYSQAYGNHDLGPYVKPYSALIFTIELISADSDITMNVPGRTK